MGQDVYDYEQIVQTSPDADKLQAVREKMIDADPIYAVVHVRLYRSAPRERYLPI